MIGQIISHYRILEKLGGGGMGVVYKAEDTKLKRTIALKFLPPELTRDPEAKERFIHEAQAASALDHPNICTVHEIDEAEGGQMFICMAYYEGQTLKKKIAEGPLKIEDAIDTGIQIAQGLVKAHQHGIVHRDIKPANVMLTDDGIVKIVDFGLAKLAGRTVLTKLGSTVGTVAYMSPEQARGETVDHRTDIWSLGVVLYEMVTGHVPFKGDYENAVLYSILIAEQQPMTAIRTGVPMELEHIVNKTIAKNPNERYQHADELLVDLRRLKKETETVATVRIAEPGVERRKKSPIRKIFAGIAAVVLIAFGILFLRPLIFENVLVSEPKPIAVISFANQTGDKAYDYLQDAIPNLLITSLEQSKYLRVTTWERMYDLLKQLGKADVKVIDRDMGFDLCRRDGIEVIVLGSFTKAGETFATDVKVLDVQTKQLLKSASSRGEGVASILKSQIDELSRQISRGIGLSERRVEATRSQIAEHTTNSMEAYNYFLRGKEDYQKFYFQNARQFLERAIRLDSTFALAYLYLAWTYRALNDATAMGLAFEKARAFSQKVSEKDRLKIGAAVAIFVENNREKGISLMNQVLEKYPKEKDVYYYLGVVSFIQGDLGRATQALTKALELDPQYPEALNQLAYAYARANEFEKAIECLKKYAAVNPGDVNPFDSMGEIYFQMGRLDEAIAEYKEAIEVKPDFLSSPRSLAYVYCLKEEYAQGLVWIDHFIAIAPSSGAKAVGYFWRSTVLTWMGRCTEALNDLRRTTELAGAVGSRNWQALADLQRGWIYYERGETDLSRGSFTSWSKFALTNDTAHVPRYRLESDFNLGLVDLLDRKTDAARSRLQGMQSILPHVDAASRSLARSHYEQLYTEVLLAQDSLEKAIAVCDSSSPPEVPTFSVGERVVLYNFPLVRDVKARAFLKKGHVDEAIAEYERLIAFDPKGMDRRMISPKYHYRLAKLYEQKGWRAKAIKEYKRFLETWKDADKNLPDPPDARKRLARLMGQK